jgi:hypothetical protein
MSPTYHPRNSVGGDQQIEQREKIREPQAAADARSILDRLPQRLQVARVGKKNGGGSTGLVTPSGDSALLGYSPNRRPA